ncbi:MAG TPA: hypothetical protein VFZ78_08565 [Flavisolibacter sp.]
MKRILLALVFLVAGFLIVQYLIRKDKETKNVSQSVSRHSLVFNQGIASLMDEYYKMTAAFVRWDSAAVNTHVSAVRQQMDSIRISELAQDSTLDRPRAENLLNAARGNISAMAAQTGLDAKRQLLNTFTLNLYAFLDVIKYDRSRLYLQKCPMAFNDTGAGVWISAGDSIRNPYLGLHHPQYGKGMLKCGENESVLDYTKGPDAKKQED